MNPKQIKFNPHQYESHSLQERIVEDWRQHHYEKKQNRKYFNIMIGLLVLVIFIIAITTMGNDNINKTKNMNENNLLDMVTTYGQGRPTGLMRGY